MVTLEKAQIHIGWYNKNIKGNMIAQIYIGKYNKTNKENIGRSIDLHRNVYQEQQRKHGKQHRFRQECITKITKETWEKAQIQVGSYNRHNKGTMGKSPDLDRKL